MIKKKIAIGIFTALSILGIYASAQAAPYYRVEETIIPRLDASYDLGTSTANWRNFYVNRICLSADICRTTWPTGGGGGSADYPFVPTTNYAVLNQATTGIAWFQNGMNASSTSHLVYASTTAVTAQSANILRLDNLTSAGFVKTNSIGTLSVDTSTYLTSAVTAVTGTWPIISSGGNTPNITWGGLSTSSPITSGAAVLYTTGVNTIASVATSTLTPSSPLGGSFIQIGSGGSITCTTASASAAGCISAASFSKHDSATTTFSSPLVYTSGTNAVTCPTCNVSNASVSSVATNNGLTGGTITTTGTIGLDLTAYPVNNLILTYNGTRLIATGTPTLTVGNLVATSTASSTFGGAIATTYASTTATSTMAGINLPYGGCVAVGGTCLTSNTGTVTSVATNNGLTGGAITTTGTIGLDLTAYPVNNLLLTYNGTRLTATGTQALTAGYFIATTTIASTFPYASTTALSVSGLTSGNCVQAGTGGLLTTVGAACGSGGGSGVWPFTTTDTNYAVAVQSTTTPEWFKNGLMASTTSYFVYASTTAITAQSANIGRLDNLTSNGFVKTSGGIGNLSVDTNTYLTTAVTSVATNQGLTGGTITTTGTVGLDLTAYPVNNLVLTYNGTRLTATGTPALTVGYLIGTSTASTTLAGPIATTYASTTATSTMSGINLPYGGCFAVAGTCMTSNTGTVTSVATNNGLTGGTITGAGTIGFDLTKIVNNTLVMYNGSQLQATGTQMLTVGGLWATTTTATSTFYGTLSVGSSTPNGAALFSIGTSTPLFTADKNTGNMWFDNGSLYVDSNTNRIGIGNTSPNTLLDIADPNAGGSANSLPSNTQLAIRGAYSSGNADGLYGRIFIGADANRAYGAWIGTRRDGSGNMHLQLGTDMVGTLTTTMNISNVGNVGIGTTTPFWTLQVASATPYLAITDTDAATNAKHILLSNIDGTFTVGTSSDSLTSTSSIITFATTGSGHRYASTSAPTLSSGQVDGTDAYGRVTSCSSVCTVTFATAYTRAPSCIVTPETGSIVNTFTYSVSATAITVTETGLGTFDYMCNGQ